MTRPERDDRPHRRAPARSSRTGPGQVAPGADSRRVAADALVAIERDESFANLRLGPVLDRSGLDARDRRLVTELVYGAIRRRRSLDYLVDRFLISDPSPELRALLRVGAYQIHYTDVPDHAAVAATVGAAPQKWRGVLNAVLRKVAAQPVSWPDEPTRLSVPDWLYRRLVADLGTRVAIETLDRMNVPPSMHRREDGYVQDPGSQRIVEWLAPGEGDVVLDLCAAPGGKATGLGAGGATVVAMDRRHGRVQLTGRNVAAVGASVGLVIGDACAPPFADGVADLVLVDAPCSGLGVLRRRPDARWRVDEQAVERLAAIQVAMLAAAAPLVRRGGRLAFSVCTLTAAETTGVAEAFERDHPDWSPLPPPSEPWMPSGSGAVLLPQADDSDGMALFLWRRP
ncbi:MAG: transcription antitermination factor NusB [Microthrixaceae bacterium]